jgi:hypothetical protein
LDQPAEIRRIRLGYPEALFAVAGLAPEHGELAAGAAVREIRRRLARRPDRFVRRGCGTGLHVARRRERGLRGALDLAEELGVGGGLVGLVQQELKGLLRLERAEGAA